MKFTCIANSQLYPHVVLSTYSINQDLVIAKHTTAARTIEDNLAHLHKYMTLYSMRDKRETKQKPMHNNQQ